MHKNAAVKGEFRNLIVRDLMRLSKGKALDPGGSNPNHKQGLGGEWMENPAGKDLGCSWMRGWMCPGQRSPPAPGVIPRVGHRIREGILSLCPLR